jgi:hypothetical protein
MDKTGLSIEFEWRKVSVLPGVMSYPVFMSKPSTDRMHDTGSNVPHIRSKGFTEN